MHMLYVADPVARAIVIFDILKMFIRAYSLIINKMNRSLYMIIKVDNGLWKVSPNIQYLLELFVISSNNQIMYKLLFILFINF